MAQRRGDLGRASELMYGVIPDTRAAAGRETGDGKLVNEAVTEEGIAAVGQRWTGVPVDTDAGRRAGQAAAHGRPVAPAGDRPGRRPDRGCPRGAAGTRRPAGSQPADRQLPVPRPDRRRQDRADQGAGRVPVRRREGHGAHRHERVHGEARGLPADRRPAGLCRLRRGRRADRGGAPPAVPGDPVRRGREGARGRLQRAAAGARRRPADGRAGPHGGFHATPSSC